MKLNVDFKVNLKDKEIIAKTTEATRLGLRDTIVAIHADAMAGSPKKTGHNIRSITSEVSGMGTVVGSGSERVVNDEKMESACYSTSGYGGFLEVGTSRMAARPYFRPALDKNKGSLISSIKGHMK